MQAEIGRPTYPIWILGDSNPKNWDQELDSPLDPRHPTRHNIWTPVVEVIQAHIFLWAQCRLDTLPIYIRNATVLKTEQQNLATRGERIQQYRLLLIKYRPVIVFCMGQFSYELARHALNENLVKFNANQWTIPRLGDEFRRSHDDFDISQINLIPLLHASIARGRFLDAHNRFCASEHSDYFEYVGQKISAILLDQCRQLEIWAGSIYPP